MSAGLLLDVDVRPLLLWSLLLLIALFAVGLGPTVSMAGRAAVPAMLAGGVVAWLGSLTGALALRLMASKDPSSAPTAALLATAVRMGTVVLLAVAVALAGGLPAAPFLIWTALGHLVLLVADTVWTVRIFQPREDR